MEGLGIFTYFSAEILLFIEFMDIPIFSLNFVPMKANDEVRVDVMVSNLPPHFLGAAFDLVADFESWGFVRAELGELFNVPDHTFILTTRRDQPARLVFGMSLERNFVLAAVPDGENRLVSFYIKTSSQGWPKFSFNHGVLSVFDGQRRDIADVQWQGGQFTLLRFPRVLWAEFTSHNQTQQLTTNTQALSDNVFGSDRPGNAIADVYWLMSVVLVFSFVVLLVFFIIYRFGRKSD